MSANYAAIFSSSFPSVSGDLLDASSSFSSFFAAFDINLVSLFSRLSSANASWSERVVTLNLGDNDDDHRHCEERRKEEGNDWEQKREEEKDGCDTLHRVDGMMIRASNSWLAG